jgi:hypothetical protein
MNHLLHWAAVWLLAGGAAVADAEAPLPTRDRVGPEAMPKSIEPLATPWPMLEPVRPRFAAHSVDLTAALAAAGTESATGLIQRAIDDLAARGGGRVVIPPGRWRTGRIQLRSGIDLHLAAGAVLEFSGSIEDYLPPVETWYEGVGVMTAGGLVYADRATNVAVTGSGTLIGPETGGLCESQPGLVETFFDPATPVAARICDGLAGRRFLRPNFLVFFTCRNVLVERVTLRRGPMWHVSPIDCDNVIIRGVSIESRGVGNGDGIDVVACRNVLVEYCQADTGDDAYAVKAGRSAGFTPAGRETRNVVFRRNLAVGGTGGIACGSETAGGIRNVHVHDCIFEGVKHAIFLKTRRPRSGGGEGWLLERIVVDSRDTAILVDMLGSVAYAGDLAARLPPRPVTPQTPRYRDLVFRRIVGRSGNWALKIKGLPERPVSDVVCEACDLTGERLVSLADVDGVAFRRCRLAAEQPEITLLNARDVTFEGCQVEAAAGPVRPVLEEGSPVPEGLD